MIRRLFKKDPPVEKNGAGRFPGEEWLKPIPASVKIDQSKVTDFGQQIATLLTMAADQWVMMPDLSRFSHSEYGMFVFKGEKLYHMAREAMPGALMEPGRQRVITDADQVLICEALAAVATSAMTPPEPIRHNVAQAAQQAPQKSGGLLSAQSIAQLQAQQQSILNQQMVAMQRAFLEGKPKQDHMLDAMRYQFGITEAAQPAAPVARQTLASDLQAVLKANTASAAQNPHAISKLECRMTDEEKNYLLGKV